jgi:hypothetical protein
MSGFSSSSGPDRGFLNTGSNTAAVSVNLRSSSVILGQRRQYLRRLTHIPSSGVGRARHFVRAVGPKAKTARTG